MMCGNYSKEHERDMVPKFKVANFLEQKRQLLSNIQGQYLEKLYKPNQNHSEEKRNFDIYLLHFLYLLREYLIIEDPEHDNKSIYRELPIVNGKEDGRKWIGLKSVEDRMESADLKLKGDKSEAGARRKLTVEGKAPQLPHQVSMNAYKNEMIAYNKLGFSSLSTTKAKGGF